MTFEGLDPNSKIDLSAAEKLESVLSEILGEETLDKLAEAAKAAVKPLEGKRVYAIRVDGTWFYPLNGKIQMPIPGVWLFEDGSYPGSGDLVTVDMESITAIKYCAVDEEEQAAEAAELPKAA